MSDARITLIVQVHELVDQIERTLHLFDGDAEGRKQAECCIAYARKVSEPYNYNGPTREHAAAQQEIARLRAALDEIGGLSRHLRNGGPDESDLEELSDGLENAVHIAVGALEQTK